MMYSKFHSNPSRGTEVTRGGDKMTDTQSDTQTFITLQYSLMILKKLLLTYNLISCPVRYRIITPEPTVLKTKKSPMNLMLIKATATVLESLTTVESVMSENISPAKLLAVTIFTQVQVAHE